MDRQVFVPFSEPLIEALGLSIGELVPFQLEYDCLHLADADLENEGWLEVAIGE